VSEEAKNLKFLIKLRFAKLIEPNDNITNFEKRNHSQLLASVLLALIFIQVFVAFPLIALTHSYPSLWEYKEFFLITVATFLAVLGYYLNKFGLVYLTTGLLIIISAGIFIVWAMIDNTLEGVYALNYLVIPILISSILLPFKACLAVFAVTTFFVATAIPLITKQATQGVINDVVLFNVIIGSIIIMVTFYRNMLENERKKELAENEDRYRTLVEIAFEGILIHDDGKILEANSGFAGMFGYTAEEVSQLYLRDIFQEGSRDILKAKFRNQITEPTEALGIRKDKSLFDIEVIAKFQAWRGRKVRLMALRDISDQKKSQKAAELAKLELELRVVERTAELAKANSQLLAEIERRVSIEKALKSSEEHFRLLFENAPVAVYQTNSEGVLLTANQALAGMFGYRSVTEMLGMKVTDLYANPNDRVAKTDALNSTGSIHNIELELRDVFGRSITVLDNARLVQKLDDSSYYEGSLVNITERKQAERDILRALEREKELNELKYNFITMASHNFRTPLSVVLSSAELLEHYGANWSEEKKHQHLSNIQQAVIQLTDLLDEFSSMNNDSLLVHG
jgi:PAS domain S-box-containing protein